MFRTRYRQDHDSASHHVDQWLGIPLWDVVSDPEAVRSLGGRSARGSCSSVTWLTT